MALFLLRRLWPPRFAVTFDQLTLLLVVNLATWGALDYLHAGGHVPLELDGLFGWACYLLLGLMACALVARADSPAADTRSLLVPLLATSPFVLVLFWLGQDLAFVQSHALVFTVLAIVYLVVLATRVLGAAYGKARPRAAILAVLLIFATPWALEFLNLDTRLWVAEGTGAVAP